MSKTDIKSLCASRPYLEAYTAHTDLRVEEDPKSAVGGMWDKIGPLQLDDLIANGFRLQGVLAMSLTWRKLSNESWDYLAARAAEADRSSSFLTSAPVQYPA